MGSADVQVNTPGQRIRLLRKAKGMTQETLARRVFVTQPAVAQWESDTWTPTPTTQQLLADELGTSRRFLFPAEEAV